MTELSNESLRCAIAELHGYVFKQINSGAPRPVYAWVKNGFASDPPNYPTDIFAATSLVDEVQAEPTEYAVEIHRTVVMSKLWHVTLGVRSGHDESLPRAICLAYCALHGITSGPTK